MMKKSGLVVACMLVILTILSSYATGTSKVKDNIDTKIKVKNFLQEWKDEVEHGVTSQQIKNTINKLKTYKKEIDDKELLSEIDLEISRLEVLLDIMGHKNSEPEVVEIKDEYTFYPNSWRYGYKGYAKANATIHNHTGYAETLTDAFAFTTAKAYTYLFLCAKFLNDVPAKVTFEGEFGYRWIALESCLGLFIDIPIYPSPRSEGDLIAEGYVYNTDDDVISTNRFLEEKAKPSLFILLWTIGSEKKYWRYSTSLSTQYFKKGKTYEIGVYEVSKSTAEGFARNQIYALWSLEKIKFTVSS